MIEATSPSASTTSGAGAHAVEKISPEQQALLLCSRRRLDARQSECLASIVSRGLDLPRFVAGAYSNLVVPLVAKHVLPMLQHEAARELREVLTDARNRAVLRMMHVCALKHDVVTAVLNQRAIPYFEVKGSVLSQELYGDPFIRQYRDIDLLLDPRRLEEAADALLKKDWRITNKEWDPAAGRDLSVLSQYQAAIELCSPTGVVLELHRTLDNSGCVFDTREIFAASGRHSKLGRLRNEMQFAYMLFHHSRHKWSSLHWCADADSLAKLPQDTVDTTQRTAEQLGLLKTFEETLRLVQNLGELALNGRTPASGRSLFLEDCVRAMRQTAPQESDVVFAEAEAEDRQPDFAYEWQKTPGYRLKFAVSRFRPSLNDYNWMPMETHLRWIYWLTKPLRFFQKTAGTKKTR